MKLYHFSSPNPQKVTFALKELGLECELVPVDLSKGEQKAPTQLFNCKVAALYKRQK
jgi:glutathione S-transferase